MKEPYRWNYNIKIKTKEGTFEYEDKLENVDKILEKHPNYEEIQATRNILKCDKCHIELNEIFVQQGEFRTYRLCKTCNDRYLQYMENVKKLEKRRNRNGIMDKKSR